MTGADCFSPEIRAALSVREPRRFLNEERALLQMSGQIRRVAFGFPGGTFTMGSNSGEAEIHERPSHLVTGSRSFYMATTEVTQAQWNAVIGTNPSEYRGEDLSVEQGSWLAAEGFRAYARFNGMPASRLNPKVPSGESPS